MRNYMSKSAFFEGGGSLCAQISYRRGRRPPNTVDIYSVSEGVPRLLEFLLDSDSYLLLCFTRLLSAGHFYASVTL